MKKLLLTIVAAMMMAMIVPSTLYAQLKVNSNGSVSLSDSSTAVNKVFVEAGNTFSSASTNFYSEMKSLSRTLNAAIAGNIEIHSSSANKCTVGVFGSAMGGQVGLNYGVVGSLPNVYGAAIYGTTNLHTTQLTGIYAGYFNGTTYVNGQTYTQSLLIPSDIRLKQNVMPLCELDSDGSALEKVLSMNVLSYNYINKEEEKSIPLFASDEQLAIAEKASLEARQSRAEELHFGMSAQELKEIYPNLVVEGQDGYLAVNYIELVPVLIRSIQELNERIKDLESLNSSNNAKKSNVSSVESLSRNKSVLYQNSPNPFSERTEIRFEIADDAYDACICIFNLQGKMLKKMAVSKSDNSISIGSDELGAGMYLYSLIVDGEEISTKRMILSK